MGVQASLLSTFSDSLASPSSAPRFLKVVILAEQASLALAVPPSGSAKDDFTLIGQKAELKENEAAWILYRLDKSGEWTFISYVPDGAKVREKMLYSSSKTRLMKALGEAHFTDSIHATTLKELTPQGYAAHLAALAAPAPLTDRERALKEVIAAEAEASREERMAGMRGTGGPLGALMLGGAGGGAKGKGLEWEEGVEAKLRELGEWKGEGEEGLLVGLTITSTTPPKLSLSLATTSTLSSLSTHLPPSSPQYTLFAFRPTPAPAPPITVLVYTCPGKSAVRMRMVYSSSLGGVLARAKEECGVEVFKKIESSEPATLTKAEILSSLGPLPTASAPSITTTSSSSAVPSATSNPSTPHPSFTNGGTGLSTGAGAEPLRQSSAPSSLCGTTGAPFDGGDGAAAGGKEVFAKPKGPARRAGTMGRVQAQARAFEASR